MESNDPVDEHGCGEFIKRRFEKSSEFSLDHQSDIDAITYPAFVILTLLYLPVLVYIYIKRNKQAVHFKSPFLIIVGGISLFCDSLLNIIIARLNTKDDAHLECFLSIFTTTLPHYSSLFCLIFRAERIIDSMNLENAYIENMYKMIGQIPQNDMQKDQYIAIFEKEVKQNEKLKQN